MRTTYKKIYLVTIAACLGLSFATYAQSDTQSKKVEKQSSNHSKPNKTKVAQQKGCSNPDAPYFKIKELQDITEYTLLPNGYYIKETTDIKQYTDKITKAQYEKLDQATQNQYFEYDLLPLNTNYMPDIEEVTGKLTFTKPNGKVYFSERLNTPEEQIALYGDESKWEYEQIGKEKFRYMGLIRRLDKAPCYRKEVALINNIKKGDIVSEHRIGKFKNPFQQDFLTFVIGRFAPLRGELLEFRFHVPEGMFFNIHGKGYKITKTNTLKPKHTSYIVKQQPLAEANPSQNKNFEYSVFISTAPSWQAYARDEYKHMMHMVEVTPTVKALAEKLTQGATSELEKAQRIDRWVKENIRYQIPFSFRNNFINPALNLSKTVDEILQSRQGDCKDYTTLLISLLKAVNINAVPVLINTEPRQTTPASEDLPFAGRGFGHVIVYIPSLKLYSDGTTTHTRLGQLDNLLIASQSLRLDTGEVLHLTAPFINQASVNQQITLTADGFAKGNSTVIEDGGQETSLRYVWREKKVSVNANESSASSEDRQLYFQRMGRYHAHQAFSARFADQKQLNATITEVSAIDYSQPLSTKSTFELPLLWKNKNEKNKQYEFYTPGGISSYYPLPGIAQTFLDTKQDFEKNMQYACPNVHNLNETISFNIDKQLHIIKLPNNIDIDNQWFQFKAQFKQIGQRIELTRNFVNKTKSYWCDTATMQAGQQMRQIVLDHLNQTWMVELNKP